DNSRICSDEPTTVRVLIDVCVQRCGKLFECPTESSWTRHFRRLWTWFLHFASRPLLGGLTPLPKNVCREVSWVIVYQLATILTEPNAVLNRLPLRFGHSLVITGAAWRRS